MGELSDDFLDEEETSDFACIECGEECDETDCCDNEECELFGAGDGGFMSDNELRAEERKQMGITS